MFGSPCGGREPTLVSANRKESEDFRCEISEVRLFRPRLRSNLETPSFPGTQRRVPQHENAAGRVISARKRSLDLGSLWASTHTGLALNP